MQKTFYLSPYLKTQPISEKGIIFEEGSHSKSTNLNPSLRNILFCTILFCWTRSEAQQKIVYPHAVIWSKLEVNQLDENYKWGWGADVVYRRKSGLNDNNPFREPLRTSFRPWINYQITPNARFSFSPLGFMKTDEYIGKPEDLLRPAYRELRTTFQFFHHIKPGNPRFMHTWRYRYELRWQENPANDNWRYLNRFRMRYRLRYTFLGNDFYENNSMYAMISNEIGLNIGKNVLYNTFNQNRLYVGAGYRFLNTVRAEIRYVDRFRTRGATGIEFDHGRGVMFALYIDQLKGMGKQDSYKIQFTD